MNQTTQISFNANMIFVLVGGLIVLAMIMGRRSGSTQRSSLGWWVGLGILLAIVSGFLGFNRLRVSPITEVRHANRAAFSEMKEAIQNGVENLRESLQQSASELSKSAEEVQQVLSTSTAKSNGKKKSNVTATVKVPAPPALPTKEVYWTVEVTGDDRKQKKSDVDKLLMEKAVRSVNRWITDRMPIQNLHLNVTNELWLQDHGAFPEAIEYPTVDVPRVDPKLTDPLMGGTMKVFLSPTVQETLLAQGYQQLEAVLRDNHFEAQGIVTIILLGITGLCGLLALVKMTVEASVRRLRSASE